MYNIYSKNRNLSLLQSNCVKSHDLHRGMYFLEFISGSLLPNQNDEKDN